MTNSMPANRATLWTAIVALVALFGSLGLACMFPFVAVATVAALTLSLPRALGLTATVWAANQLVGFAFLHYPQVADTYLLGLVLLVGAFAAVAVARTFARGAALLSPRSLGAVALGFVAYETIQYVGALAFGGADSFTLPITAGIALNDLGWFLVLGGLHRLLAIRSLPVVAPSPELV